MTPVPDEKFETDFEIETGPFQLIHNFHFCRYKTEKKLLN
jgi:hypothetical protein